MRFIITIKLILVTIFFVSNFFYIINKSFSYSNDLKSILNEAGVKPDQQKTNLPNVDNKTTSTEKTNHIMYSIIETLLILSGIISVIFIFVGGVEYVISAGEEERLNGAKAKILNAIYGLIIVIFSYAILTNVVNFLEQAD
jgi:amino acid transporter